MRRQQPLLLLALLRRGLGGKCPVDVADVGSKFQLLSPQGGLLSLNDQYVVADEKSKPLARVSDSPSLPKVMTLYTLDGDPWASASEDLMSGELSFWDCAGGLIASLKKPATGTVIRNRAGDNVAEVGVESEAKVKLSGEAQLAGEAGEHLATMVRESQGPLVKKITVEIQGAVWHHTPYEPPAGESDTSTTEEELQVAGRRMAKAKEPEPPQDGNPALDPAVLALLAALTMGNSRYYFGGKLVSVILVSATLLLGVVVCCFAGKRRNPCCRDADDEGFITDQEDFDSDDERAKRCLPGSCCSRGPLRGTYNSLPKAAHKK